jgi:hypothetical protein
MAFIKKILKEFKKMMFFMAPRLTQNSICSIHNISLSDSRPANNARSASNISLSLAPRKQREA